MTTTKHVEKADELLSIGKVADWLGKTHKTLRVWDKDGKLPALRTPTNQRMYRRSDVEKLLKDGRK